MDKIFASIKPLGLAAVAALVFLLPAAAPAQSGGVTVMLNGQTMSFDQPPVVQSGRVFVPLRSIFEGLGATVVYTGGQINATQHGRTISLTIGSTQATVNGQPVTLDVAPFVVGDRTLVPLRFVAQSLGAQVAWNDSNSTVTIQSRGGAVSVAPVRKEEAVDLVATSPTGAVAERRPTIDFRLSEPTQLDRIHVTLDGTDVTEAVTQTGPRSFSLVPPFPLQPSSHRVRVFGEAQPGNQFALGWSFQTTVY